MDEIDRDLKKPIGFRPNTDWVDPECITLLHHLGETGSRSEWLSKAAQFYYNYERYKVGFLVRLIQENFKLCKKILRKIGQSRKLL